jgi:hypothetical protein
MKYYQQQWTIYKRVPSNQMRIQRVSMDTSNFYIAKTVLRGTLECATVNCVDRVLIMNQQLSTCIYKQVQNTYAAVKLM